MRRILQLFFAMTRWERWILSLLFLLLVTSTVGLTRLFYLRNTVLVPAKGGTYIEGSVGELLPLNPWFIVQNDVNRDIVSLVFSGLLRYNPQSEKIEEDLATMTSSKDAKVYTLRLKDDLYWHDSTEEDPHPVTVDDVLFTFKTVQDSQFPNALFTQNFRGVTIDKVDERTVRFSLEEPYSFFPSNLTLGLLPKRAFEGIPVNRLDQTIDFGYAPIGAGPYKVKSIVRTDLSTEVTLERFDRPLEPAHRLDRVVFRIFSDYSSLLSDLRTLEGVRLVPRNSDGAPIIPKRFTPLTYSLPQYVALFFNMDRPALQDQKLRVGLQQGTDKQELVDAIHESIIVDTPLLEIDTTDWRYKFDSDAAQGALLASRWNLPERVRLQRLLEQEDANVAGLIHPEPIVLLEKNGVFTLSGAYASIPRDAKINGNPIRPSPTSSDSWFVDLPMYEGTGALLPGENLVKVTTTKSHIVDSFYITGTKDPREYGRAVEERRLALLYRDTKNGPVDGTQVTIADLALEDGRLRKRTSGDPVSTRINEKGEPLTLRLLTTDSPASYPAVAERVKKQWASLGVQIEVQIAATPQEFQDRLLRRDYDVLLFGQSLLDNLDSFPYWHSSGIQKLTGQDKDLRQDAYNLSQYVSFRADTQLEIVRRTTDERERKAALTSLQEILRDDAPAIFLYSPMYVFAHRSDIFGIELGSLSLHSDRFLTLYKWYVKREREFNEGKSWWSFFGWIPTVF